MAAVLHPAGPGGACLQVHPDYRAAELEIEMITTAETQFATVQPDGSQRLVLWAHEGDRLRQDLLARRGYTRGPNPEYQRRRGLDGPIAEVSLAAGYTVRALGDEAELPARSWLAWRAFHAGEPDENYPGWDWYRRVQRAPLYRRDLDLVAVAPDGGLAALATVWFDDVTRTATFRPVGVHPDHQQRGLGRALVTEGLQRAAHLGATLATAEVDAAAADALFVAAGFVERECRKPWIRQDT
jgi:GNAT superfamily N-acetyltransferase